MERPTAARGEVDRARADTAFLAGSWNRLDVLEAVAAEPRTRAALLETVDVSRVTLSRILSDLESRGWLAQEGDTYEATTAGAYVASEVDQLLANLGTLNLLGENISWLRLEEFGFDLAHLDDADVITPSWDDFSAQTSRLIDLVSDCTSIRGIGTGLDRAFMKAVHAETLDGSLEVDLVFEPPVVDAINAEPELARRFQELADHEDATIRRYQGNESLMELGINETVPDRQDVVMLCGEHDVGAPPGTVASTDDTVWDWAVSYFERRRASSHRLRADSFTP